MEAVKKQHPRAFAARDEARMLLGVVSNRTKPVEDSPPVV